MKKQVLTLSFALLFSLGSMAQEAPNGKLSFGFNLAQYQ